MEDISLSSASNNLAHLITQVNLQSETVRIISEDSEMLQAVLVSAAEWDAIQETLYLERTGTLAKVRERQADDSGFTDIDELIF